MQLVRKLLSLARSRVGRNQKIRGLSTAELVGIIVIIGILGALGGTYIGSLVTTANGNTGNSNASSLNSLCASMLAAGVPISQSGGVYTVGGTVCTDPQNPTSGDAGLVYQLNQGIVDPNNLGVTYKLTPAIKTTVSYTSAPSGTPISVLTWTYTGTQP